MRDDVEPKEPFGSGGWGRVAAPRIVGSGSPLPDTHGPFPSSHCALTLRQNRGNRIASNPCLNPTNQDGIIQDPKSESHAALDLFNLSAGESLWLSLPRKALAQHWNDFPMALNLPVLDLPTSPRASFLAFSRVMSYADRHTLKLSMITCM